MNPMSLLTIKPALDKFQKNHPKFIQFIKSVSQAGVHEGTVIECKVITPDGKEIQSNIRITQDDLELLEKLKGLSQNN